LSPVIGICFVCHPYAGFPKWEHEGVSYRIPPLRRPNAKSEDIQVTQQIVEASKLLDIEVLDHPVIGQQRYVSLKERGLGFK